MDTDSRARVVGVVARAGRGLLGTDNAERIVSFLRHTPAPVTAGQVFDNSKIVMESPYGVSEISSALEALVAQRWAARAGRTWYGARRYMLTAEGGLMCGR